VRTKRDLYQCPLLLSTHDGRAPPDLHDLIVSPYRAHIRSAHSQPIIEEGARVVNVTVGDADSTRA
jgi:hypothetical protein